MRPIFLHYLLLWKPLAYILAFFGMIIGGDETLFITSFLARGHFFKFRIVVLILIAGAFFGDFLWYSLGKWLRPESFLYNWIMKAVSRLDNHLKNKPFRTIFLSKFIYGFNHITLIRAGMLGAEPREFFFADALAIFSWGAIICWFGYFSSFSLWALRHIFRYTEVALLLGLLSFIILEGLVRHWLKKRI